MIDTNDLGQLWRLALVFVFGAGTASMFARKVLRSNAQDLAEQNAITRSDKQAQLFAEQAAEMAKLVGELRTEVVHLGENVALQTIENAKLVAENERLHNQVEILVEENRRLNAEVTILKKEVDQLKKGALD